MIRVVAAAIVEDGTVLAARRAPDVARGGLWELPGGKVEAGETDEDALIREIAEELGAAITVGDRLADARFDYPDVSIHLVAYVSRLRAGPPAPREHAELRWVTADELADLDWAPADLPLLGPLAALLRG